MKKINSNKKTLHFGIFLISGIILIRFLLSIAFYKINIGYHQIMDLTNMNITTTNNLFYILLAIFILCLYSIIIGLSLHYLFRYSLVYYQEKEVLKKKIMLMLANIYVVIFIMDNLVFQNRIIQILYVIWMIPMMWFFFQKIKTKVALHIPDEKSNFSISTHQIATEDTIEIIDIEELEECKPTQSGLISCPYCGMLLKENSATCFMCGSCLKEQKV